MLGLPKSGVEFHPEHCVLGTTLDLMNTYTKSFHGLSYIHSYSVVNLNPCLQYTGSTRLLSIPCAIR